MNAKSRKYRGVIKIKSRIKTWQVRGIRSQQLEHKQVPKRGTEPGVRKGKRSQLQMLHGNHSLFGDGQDRYQGHEIGIKSVRLRSHCWSRIRMSFYKDTGIFHMGMVGTCSLFSCLMRLNSKQNVGSWAVLDKHTPFSIHSHAFMQREGWA